MHEKESVEKTGITIGTDQLVLIGLAVLFLMGALQTVQLANTLSQLNSGALSLVSGSATAATAAPNNSAPLGNTGGGSSAINNLPAQVGGC